jgi:hypothetical protein
MEFTVPFGNQDGSQARAPRPWRDGLDAIPATMAEAMRGRQGRAGHTDAAGMSRC